VAEVGEWEWEIENGEMENGKIENGKIENSMVNRNFSDKKQGTRNK
jgi:hypothetical protein